MKQKFTIALEKMEERSRQIEVESSGDGDICITFSLPDVFLSDPETAGMEISEDEASELVDAIRRAFNWDHTITSAMKI